MSMVPAEKVFRKGRTTLSEVVGIRRDTAQFNFLYEKKLLSCIVSTCYAIVQIRGPQETCPAIRGASGLSPLSSALKRFPVVPVSPPPPGSQDEGIPHRKRQARFLWEFHISSGEVQQLIHRGSLLV